MIDDGKPPGSILPLRFENVSYAAGGHRLIKDISFTLHAGARTIVLGPNGAGKSLLLRLCHGLLQPSDGRIIWQGAPGAPTQRHQAMVFQRPVMLRRSAAANVAYALSAHGVPRAERARRVAEVLERAGLIRLADSPARVLSFGEQQRLAVARAWALRPQVMFLDEPTANMDPANTHAFETVLADIHASGTKIIMTTHDLPQARRLADEVLFLSRGRLLEQAPAAQFFAMPANDLARAFIEGELLWWRRRETLPLDRKGRRQKP